jgi:hypothetical protein
MGKVSPELLMFLRENRYTTRVAYPSPSIVIKTSERKNFSQFFFSFAEKVRVCGVLKNLAELINMNNLC